MLHKGFSVSLGSQLISIKTSHDPKMAMLYNTKYVNLANTTKATWQIRQKDRFGK